MPKFTQAEIAEAAKTALGRKGKGASDPALFAMYQDYGGNLDELKRAFASTPEAAKAGVTGFDVEYVDPSSLSDSDKTYFEAYKRGFGTEKLSRTMLEQWKNSATPELVEAQGRGWVGVRDQGGQRVLTVSKRAWETWGDKLLVGLHAGEAALIEKGAKASVTADRMRAYTGEVDDKTAAQYDVYTKAAKKHSGVAGTLAKSVGLGSGVANALDRAAGTAAAVGGAVTGPLGLVNSDEMAAIAGGSRGVKSFQGAYEGVGVKGKDYQDFIRYGNMASNVGAGVVDAAIVHAPVFSTLNRLGSSAAASSLGQDVDYGVVGRDLAIAWATAGIGKGLQFGKNTAAAAGAASTAAKYDTAATIWSFGGSQAAGEAARGGSAEDVAWAAGRGLVLSNLPQDSTTQALGAYTLSYADAKRRGLGDREASMHASLEAAAQAAGQAAFQEARPADERVSQNPISSWAQRGRDIAQSGRDLLLGYGGAMPASWVDPSKNRYVGAEQRRAYAQGLVRDPTGVRGQLTQAFAKPQVVAVTNPVGPRARPPVPVVDVNRTLATAGGR